ncbi:hypothetical protein N566_16780 [Streptomycetaceae bacterium MP113-05]|nr:hypothetical protein N566_16780 [Streptomycetaceae bacterium MP113-05]
MALPAWLVCCTAGFLHVLLDGPVFLGVLGAAFVGMVPSVLISLFRVRRAGGRVTWSALVGNTTLRDVERLLEPGEVWTGLYPARFPVGRLPYALLDRGCRLLVTPRRMAALTPVRTMDRPDGVLWQVRWEAEPSPRVRLDDTHVHVRPPHGGARRHLVVTHSAAVDLRLFLDRYQRSRRDPEPPH